MHKILERQLRKLLPGYTATSEGLSALLDTVSSTYDDFDNDRKQLERSTEISGRELEEVNKKLNESFSLLQSTIDAVEDAIFVTDASFTLIAHNRAYEKLWQIPMDILQSGDMLKIIVFVGGQVSSPADLEARMKEIITNAEEPSLDLLYCRDGRIIERKSSPIVSGAKLPLRVWVLRDVTNFENAKMATVNKLEDLEHEKNIVEERVQERTRELTMEHARFIASISSIPLGLLVFDHTNRILIRNRAARSILNIKEKDYTFADIALAIPELKLGERLSRCLSEHMPIEVKDVEVGHKILKILMTPMGAFEEDSAEALGVVVLVEDITEARVLERGRDEFFAIASHELRTPLTAIRGNMSMIEDYYQDAITDKEVLEMVHDTGSAASRLITIVNDFLDVSRLEQGHIIFQYDDFSAAELVDGVVGELAGVAIAKGISIFAEKGEETLMVHADRDRSKQVLTNLVANAINYSSHGTIRISVERNDAYAEFHVRDEGVGISGQNQTLLFRKFQQAGESVLTRDMTQSTGLGLYISRLVIEPMGGRVWLKESETGKGSEFAFTLPLAADLVAK